MDGEPGYPLSPTPTQAHNTKKPMTIFKSQKLAMFLFVLFLEFSKYIHCDYFFLLSKFRLTIKINACDMIKMTGTNIKIENFSGKKWTKSKKTALANCHVR